LENFSFVNNISESIINSSVAEPHHFHAAPAPGVNFDAVPAPGVNFDAAPAAPAPTLLYSKAKFLMINI
jgi:hypothetical protein